MTKTEPKQATQQSEQGKAGISKTDPLQNVVADLKNLMRARADDLAELEEEKKRSREQMKKCLLELLEVVDAFDRIFQNLKERADTLEQQTKLLAGNFRAVNRLLDRVLEGMKVTPIEVALGSPAQPGMHHIMETRLDPEVEEGTILEVIQTGYFWGSDILRYPWVVAARNREEDGHGQGHRD